jgi:hypothetical protein
MTDAAFELRLEQAARHYADEAIRPIDAVAIADAAMRGSARPRAGRSPVELWSRARGILTAIATLVVAIAGIAFLVRYYGNVGEPSPSPSASPSPTASPSSTQAAVPPGGPTNGQSATWLADQPANLSFGMPSGPARMSLTISSGDLSIAVDVTSGVSGALRSSFVGFGTGDMRFTTNDAPPATETVAVDGNALAACAVGDVGEYHASTSADGMVLTLSPVSEDCPARGAVFARSWSRSLGVPGGGGTGIVDGFDPVFSVQLPAGSYVVDRSLDALTIHQDFPELQLVTIKDPQGFVDPCDMSKGRYAIAPGADPIVAYFRQLAGFTVDSTEELTVDGLRAVKLVVHANDDASCPDGRLWEYQPKEGTGGPAWFVEPGVTDSLYLVEHPKGTLLFEVLPAPNLLEQQVVDTIHFLDALPTSP